MITSHGGTYNPDLTRNASHLVAKDPDGKKYLQAPKWNIKAVGAEWLVQSIDRGMILDESLFALTIPASERGQNAWNRNFAIADATLNKRGRQEDAAELMLGRRKLRRTVSAKLSRDQSSIWQGIAAEPVTKAIETDWDDELRGIAARKMSEIPETGLHDMPSQAPTCSTIELDEASRGSLQLTKSRNRIFAGAIITIYGFTTTQVNQNFFVVSVVAYSVLMAASVQNPPRTSGIARRHRPWSE
jgi:DNA replication regulator DPB11